MHRGPNFLDKLEWYALVEEVGHRVNEDAPGLFPTSRERERFLIEPDLAGPNSAPSALTRQAAILVHAHCVEPSGHTHRVTICASWRDDRASSNRVPGCVRPL